LPGRNGLTAEASPTVGESIVISDDGHHPRCADHSSIEPLALLFVGYYARLIHSNMTEVLNSPYVRAARAKGAPETAVLFRHGLRNAMIPVVTILGIDVAGLLGGVMFVENVFALPGIGTLAVQSVFSLDVPVIMGTVMFSAVIVVAANLVVDVLYRWIDPRIKAAA
jgi:peptide/nickel transport system permease protein